MRLSFLPTIMVDAVTQLTPDFLKQQGIRLLMLDFDNTIVPYTTNTPTEAMAQWLQRMQASDVKLCVVSNSRNDRVKKFCQANDLDCITHAGKPSTRGIRQCMAQYDLEPSQCALAGDQIYTDTLGANRAGARSILVKAIHNHTILLKLRHVAEMPFILAAGKRRVNL